MRLVLLRHGETVANRDRLLLGRDDPELTELGRTQAAAAAASIGRPDRIVSSPLVRARQTAAAFGDVPVEIDERWIEVDYGAYDGRPLSSVPEEVWSAWRSDAAYAPPGGESLDAVHRRVSEACEALTTTADDGLVVVMSHVTPVKAAVAWALDVPVAVTWRLFLDLASVTVVEVGPRGPLLRAYNSTGHLGG